MNIYFLFKIAFFLIIIYNIVIMIEDFPLNIKIFNFFNSLTMKSNFWDAIFIFMAEYLILIIGIIFFTFFISKIWADRNVTLKELVIFFSGSIISYLIAVYVKYQVLAPRPFVLLNLDIKENSEPGEKAVLLLHDHINLSFPSGHTTLAFALAISIFFYSRKLGIISLVFALCVAMGRILVGVHFPIDVFAGMIIGLFFPTFIYFILKIANIKDVNNYYGSEEWKRKRNERKERERIFSSVD